MLMGPQTSSSYSDSGMGLEIGNSTAPPQSYSSISSASLQNGYRSMPSGISPSLQQPGYNAPYSQPNPQRFAPMRSQSEPTRPGGGNIREIKLIHPITSGSCNAAALLDTGCVTGNWISMQTVERLQAGELIEYGPPVTLQAANSGSVQSKGTILLDWRWSLKGVKVHTATFNVADASHYDVIIGNEYIAEKGLHNRNEDAFSPLTEHDPVISPFESEATRQARERQKREKADRQAQKEREARERAVWERAQQWEKNRPK